MSDTTAARSERTRRWLGVHQSMRVELDSLAAVLARARALATGAADALDRHARLDSKLGAFETRFARFVRLLAEHAAFEDSALFPALAAAAEAAAVSASVGPALARLEAQHQSLHEAEARVTVDIAGMRAAVRAMAEMGAAETVLGRAANAMGDLFGEYGALVLGHLSEEEAALVPLWRGLSAHAFERFQAALGASGHGGVQASAPAPARAHAPPPVSGGDSFATALAALMDAHGVDIESAKAAFEQAIKRAPPKSTPAPAPAPAPTQLRDRYGRVVDMSAGGCCFDGADGCCKGSAHARLLRRVAADQHSVTRRE